MRFPSGCGYLHVYYTSATAWSGIYPPAVGEIADVTGTGTCATSATATAIAVSAPTTVPFAHIPTFTYYTDATTCGTWPQYVDFNYPKGTAQYAANKACGVRTIDYISPSMPQNGEDDLAISWGSTSAQQSPPPSPGPYYGVLAKTSAGALVKTYNGTGYLADFHAINGAAYYQQAITDSLASIDRYNPGVVPDLIFSDNVDSTYGTSGTPADYVGWNDWATVTARAEAALTGPKLILNTLGNTTAYEYPPADDTIANILIPVKEPSVAGAMLEDVYWGNRGTALNYKDALGNPAGAWVAQEDLEIADIATGRFFNAIENGVFTTYEKTNGPGSANGVAARVYVYASVLMTYDPTRTCGLPEPGCVLFGEEMNPPSGIDAYPEQGFLALYPLQTAKATVGELKLGTAGVYARQFAGCYYRGAYVGACEVVVNPTTSTLVIANASQYRASMVLSGAGVFDGGTASFNGTVPGTLAPETAAILVR